MNASSVSPSILGHYQSQQSVEAAWYWARGSASRAGSFDNICAVCFWRSNKPPACVRLAMHGNHPTLQCTCRSYKVWKGAGVLFVSGEPATGMGCNACYASLSPPSTPIMLFPQQCVHVPFFQKRALRVLCKRDVVGCVYIACQQQSLHAPDVATFTFCDCGGNKRQWFSRWCLGFLWQVPSEVSRLPDKATWSGVSA